MLNNIKIREIILAAILTTFLFFFFFFFEVSALLDVRHCPKLQSCAISRKYNDITLRKLQKHKFQTQFGSPEISFMVFNSTIS